MKPIVIFALFILTSGAVRAQTPEKYSRVKVSLEQKNIADLARLGVEADHGEYRPGKYLINEFSASELTTIRQAGFSCEVLIEDMAAYYEIQTRNGGSIVEARAGTCAASFNPNYNTPVHYRAGTMGGYFKYEEAMAALDSMAILYPNLISRRSAISDTLLTTEGRQVFWLRISNNPNTLQASKPQVMYNAVHHAREPNSLSHVIFYMWYLLENYATNPEIKYLVDNTEMYFIPCINPDGYIYNQTTNPNGGGLWRKNRRRNADGSIGVDLNRNYGYQWAFDNVGSSPTTTSETYRGTAGFSEPETQLVRNFVRSHDFKMILNYHTYGNDLIYPWGYIDSATPDSVAFNTYSKLMVAANNYTTGFGTGTVGYTTNGDSDDWMYGDTLFGKKRILSMTPEIGAGNTGFWPPASAIDGYNKDNMYQDLMLPRLVLYHGKLADKSAPNITNTSGNLKFDITRYGMLASNYTISIRGLSSNVLSVGTARNPYTLARFQTLSDSISYNLNSNIRTGDTVTFLLSLNNGYFTYSDTVRKVFTNVGFQTILRDSCTTVANWRAQAVAVPWGLTTAVYHSAPSSITDSPGANYANNVTSSITYNKSINLVGAAKANIKFWGRWNLEAGYDYVYFGISTDSLNFTPACGLYTHNGTASQLLNQPIYDASQTSWVEETIDLSAYLGRKIWIRFTIVTDPGAIADGFYFDDLSINTQITSATSEQSLDENDWVISQSRPNPTAGEITISLVSPILVQEATATLHITDIAGKSVTTKEISLTGGKQDLSVNLNNLSNGLYLYYLEVKGKKTETRKMVISK
jgi:carboxypeptidase T